MKIVITRPEGDAEEFGRLVREAGAEPVFSPVMAIRFRDVRIERRPDEALAFTSVNGVRAFCRLSDERAAPVFAVGAATAGAAKRAGFTDVREAAGDVDSLAADISSSKFIRRIVHYAGDVRAGDLMAALQRSGTAARAVTLYEMTPIEEMTNEARLAIAGDPAGVAVSFFSPRSAELFLAQARRAALTPMLASSSAICLSDAVAAAAGPHWRSKHVASAKSAAAMADLLRETAMNKGKD